MADLYRKSALEKISNPEQLDKALVVTSPLSWLALVAVTLILVVTVVWSVVGRIPETLTLGGYVVAGNGNVSAVYSDWTGTVQKVHVRKGDPIYAETKLADIVLPDGTLKTIVSDINGRVTTVAVQVGQELNSIGQPVLYFAPTDGKLNQLTNAPVLRNQMVICYVPSKAGSDMSGQLARGNRVHLTPAGENSQSAGHMMGRVLYVEKYNASQTSVQLVTGSDQVYSDNAGNGAIKAVVILLDERQDGTAGNNPYVWSNPKGQNLTVDNGDTFTVRIIVKEVRPIEKLFAKIGEVLGW